MNDNSAAETKNITSPVYLSAKQWRMHCHDWQKTSVSKAEYCRQHGLEVTQFYYWHQQLLRELHKNTTANFIPVVTANDAVVTEQIRVELYFSDRMHLRIELGTGRLLSFIKELKELGDATAIIR